MNQLVPGDKYDQQHPDYGLDEMLMLMLPRVSLKLLSKGFECTLKQHKWTTQCQTIDGRDIFWPMRELETAPDGDGDRLALVCIFLLDLWVHVWVVIASCFFWEGGREEGKGWWGEVTTACHYYSPPWKRLQRYAWMLENLKLLL